MRWIFLVAILFPSIAFAEVFTHHGFKEGNEGISYEWYSEDPSGETGRPRDAAKVETKLADERAKRLYAQQKANAELRAKRAAMKQAAKEIADKATLTNADRDKAIKLLLEKLSE